MSRLLLGSVVICVLLHAPVLGPSRAAADDLTAEKVLRAIERAQRFLVSRQNDDGSWTAEGKNDYRTGISSLALLALVNSGMTADDPPIRNGLEYLRSVKASEVGMTYEMSLMIMALEAAGDGGRDQARIMTLSQKLEDAQFKKGDQRGGWTYSDSNPLLENVRTDRSNSQFAVLGLRSAVQAGIPVSQKTWQLARGYWLRHQNPDGGWGYRRSYNRGSTGSMTAAGISTLAITSSMLRDENEMNPDGTPKCCGGGNQLPSQPLQRAVRWMGQHFAVGHNPPRGSAWLLYYLYGLERAGRLGGIRFFGKHDWYREGATFLIERQSQRWGSWQGVGGLERKPVIGTSFALLFLSKGLSPVLMNKLEYGPEDGNDWNRHRYDVRNLTQLISGLPKWPRLVTWQVADIGKAARFGGVGDLLQAPVLYMAGKEAPEFTEQETALLREYLGQGGFIFAVANCHSDAFDRGFRQLIERIVPDKDARLKPLPPGHPVYRSEYPLDAESIDLEGVQFGCRTAIIYAPPSDLLLSCLWDKWTPLEPPDRPPELKAMITRATRVGVNVVAYATGRDPLDKLTQQQRSEQGGEQDRIERGLLQIAKLRHGGSWDAAPRALKNLLKALNRTVGMTASTKERNLPASDPEIFKYPILYMHGRTGFELSSQGRDRLKSYLQRGGVLFADACCGSWQFDQSFRDQMQRMFPDNTLERIPPDHEIFSSDVGHEIRRVKRRQAADSSDANDTLTTTVREGEPFLEGIKIGDRYAVIYSKYDISCALQRQASAACSGYLPEDAVRIGVNVVLYAVLQDVRYTEAAE